MKTIPNVQNWASGSTAAILENIHAPGVNIAIFNRETNSLTDEVQKLVEEGITFKASGDIDTILGNLKETVATEKYPHLIQDIKELLQLFKEVTTANSFRFLLATINTNMCRRFHTDANDVRMLCTYSGQGTLWLSEDNVNREALQTAGGNESIVRDETRIQQAATGAVVLLKGAIYPQENVQAIVHRSPTIAESGEKRLLLRVDTNQFLNF